MEVPSSKSPALSLIVTGAPASGKGKLIKALVASAADGGLGFKQINSVSIVRRRQKAQEEEDAAAEKEGREAKKLPGTELADQASESTKNNEEIPADVMAELMALRIREPDVADNGWLLDGWPREKKHSEALVAKGVVPTKIVKVCVSEEVLMDRQIYRRIDPTDQAIHDVRDETLSDEVRARIVTRDQDKEEAVKEKIELYNTQTAEMLSAFDPSLIVEVDGSGDDPAQMLETIKKALGK